MGYGYTSYAAMYGVHAVVVRFVGDPHSLVVAVRLATRCSSPIAARAAAAVVVAIMFVSFSPQTHIQYFLPAGTADTEQTLQAAVVAAAAAAAAAIVERPAAAALSSAARPVVVAEPVEPA